jgi:DHA2 family methylenomycin A resistance protein-like MFS transporter
MTETQIRQEEQQAPVVPKGFVKLAILLAICLGYFLVILDTTVVSVALPSIGQQLGASIAQQQWIVDGYTLVFACLLLTAGAMGDRFGSKGMFLIGLVVFTGASALCGASPTIWILQAARVVQGLGAALLVPASLSLLSAAFPDSRERARAIGIWGSVGGLGAGSGPVLGGLLINTLGWRSAFYINVPVGLLALVLTLLYVTPAPRSPQRSLDPGAQLLGIIALGLLTFICIEGGDALSWTSPLLLASAAGFVLATVLFLFIERRAHDPMLPLALFSSPTFSTSNLVGLLINFGFYGQLLLMSLYFQQVRGYSALTTGLALLPQAGLISISSWLSGRVTAHRGPRLPMLIGLLLGACGLLATMAVTGATTGYPILAPALMATGIGMSFTMPAMTAAVIASAPADRSGIASAVLNASRQVGGTLGVALLVSMVRHTFIPGLHLALICAGGAFLLAALLTFLFVRQEKHQ